MARPLIDLIGTRFGYCKVISFSRIAAGGAHWNCLCDCGNVFSRKGSSLKCSPHASCGCKVPELARLQMKTHGLSRTKEYGAWKNARDRCNKPSDPRFYCYGAVGIRMCERWLNSVEVFMQDMGRCPDGLTLERNDRSKDYEPGNCCWAGLVTQANNRSTSVFVEYQGIKMTLAQVAAREGVKYKSFHHQYSKGVSLEFAISKATKISK